MKDWQETAHCRSGAHCRVCRDREGGRRFRERMVMQFEMPPGWPTCPHGRPWGFEGPSRGLGDTVAKWIKWLTRGRVKPCGGCRERRARWNARWPYDVARREAMLMSTPPTSKDAMATTARDQESAGRRM